ncbi:SIMPL domain-containing protein [Candidatus Woesearchaeota archaeon]|nr:SIMPL domain-containing protein [Candidatus Woesearchaeota archaeon]
MNAAKKGLLYVLLAGTLGSAQPLAAEALPDKIENLRRVTVTGSAQVEIMPDEASVRLSVKTEKKDLREAQTENATLATRVTQELRAIGVGDIQTVHYSLDKMGYWDSKTNAFIQTGYQVQNTLKVTTTKLDTVGYIIDTAVKAGSNDIDGIAFDLTREAKAKLQYQLLTDACRNARDKATLLAEGVGGAVGKAITVQETNYDYVRPQYGIAKAARDSTPVQPRQLTVSAQVQVLFEIDYGPTWALPPPEKK